MCTFKICVHIKTVKTVRFWGSPSKLYQRTTNMMVELRIINLVNFQNDSWISWKVIPCRIEDKSGWSDEIDQSVFLIKWPEEYYQTLISPLYPGSEPQSGFGQTWICNGWSFVDVAIDKSRSTHVMTETKW